MAFEGLVGTYKNPNVARVEMDDEARRHLSDLLGEGGTIVGEITASTTDDEIRRLAERIALGARRA